MSIELKRKELELDRVRLGKKELEFRIEEKTAEIQKMQETIKVQDETINKLMNEIALAKGK